MNTLKDVAKNLLINTFGAKEGESLLVVTDNAKKKIGEAIWEAGLEMKLESVLVVMNERELSGEEPPMMIAKAMQNADIVITPTAKSLSHTQARIEATKCGARIATMPGITEEMFTRGAMKADYLKVQALSYKLVEILDKAERATLLKNDMKLEMKLGGRKGSACTGIHREKGSFGNLPSGEAFIAPIEDGSHGETLIDGSMVGIGKLENPLHMTLENGKLVSIQGEKSEKLDILLKSKENSTLCELGIGTNDSALLTGVVLEDEKVYGTVHIAFGTNVSMGGQNKADCHYDGIILEPTLYLDDILVLEKGQFKL